MKISKKNLIILRAALPFIVALTTALVGYTTLYIYSYYQGKTFATQTTYKVITQLDNLFTSAQTLTNAALPLLNTKCDIAHPILKQIVDNNPNIQSIDLTINKQLHCSSNTFFTTKTYLKKPTILSEYLPTTSFVLFDHIVSFNDQDFNNQHHAIITVINPDVLTKILTPKAPNQTIVLKLKKYTITYQGIITDPIANYLKVKENSIGEFPYSLEIGFNSPLNLNALIYYHYLAIIIISLVTIISFIITHWFIRNISNAYFDLDSAIRHGDIKAYVQPIYSAQQNQLIGLEVLARWHHPNEGIIMPDTFIPVAEKTGLIIPMTQQLMQQVAQTLAPYIKQIQTNLNIGFNISKIHCQDLSLVNDCKQFYKHLATDNITLIIEITERELIEVTDITKQLFKELHKLNAKIALDDFGIGNSNLSYLYDFAIDYLKIDKSFVSRINSDALSQNILDTIIEIAHNCHLESCAEGVETKQQVDYLTEKGVTYLQGYYFSKPIPIQDFLQSADFQKILK